MRSIAFNQAAPILDGNVMRVLTRIFALTGNPREKETNAQLWQLAEQLVRAAAVVDFNPSSEVGFACAALLSYSGLGGRVSGKLLDRSDGFNPLRLGTAALRQSGDFGVRG